MDDLKKSNLDRLFGRLYEGNVKPFDLSLFQVFPAPVDATKFDAFFATLKANGWQAEEALLPYTDDEQIGVCVFYDLVKDEYKFCTWHQFLRHNGYHVKIENKDE